MRTLIVFSSTGAFSCRRTATASSPTARPMAMPNPYDPRNRSTVSPRSMCCCATTAPTATAYSTSAVPSLIRLSARSIVSARRGSRPATMPTAVASVGARIAPNARAIITGSPNAWPMTATTAAVANTRPTLCNRIERRLLRISRSDVLSDSQ